MLFRRKKEKKRPRAVAFVDFEHWYISLEKLHGRKPDIRAWYNEASEEYDVREVYVFGDFSNPSLQNEVGKIRQVTGSIIETGNKTAYYKKDFTDFIMLDHIYQTALNGRNIDAYIIFSGDGHFSSVVSFLAMKLKKTVGVYGVRDAFSAQLKESATWVKEIPGEDTGLKGYYYPLLSSICRTEKTSGGGQMRYPTFRLTVENVSERYGIDRDEVKNALTSLIEKGVVLQNEIVVSGKKVRVLTVNKKKAETLCGFRAK